MNFDTEQSKESQMREMSQQIYDLQNRLDKTEETIKRQTAAIASALESPINNLLFNSDCKDSNNTFFEAVAGAGDSSKELAYFFTHPITYSLLGIQRVITNVLNSASVTTSAIKESTHSNWATNIQNPRWDKDKGTIIFGKTNSIDIPLGVFDSTGVTFLGNHPLRPADAMFVIFKIARKSTYVYPKGHLYCGIWNNKAMAEGWLKGTNFALTGNRAGKGIPTATISTQYMIVLETDQGFTMISDVVTIANSPTLANFSLTCYNSLAWKYLAGTRRVTVYRKFGTDNVYELTESPISNTYQDKGLSEAIDTGLTTFPVIAGKTAIESYWASTESALQNIAVDGVNDWSVFKISLSMSDSINFANVEKPFLVIGLTEPAAFKISDVVSNSTGTITSALAQFTAAMTGKAFSLQNPVTLQIQTGTVTYVSPTELTLSSSCPWTENNNILIVDDCIEDAFEIDTLGLSYGKGIWSPRSEDLTLPKQLSASNPNGSTQGTGNIDTGVNDDPIYGGRQDYGYDNDFEWMLR